MSLPLRPIPPLWQTLRRLANAADGLLSPLARARTGAFCAALLPVLSCADLWLRRAPEDDDTDWSARATRDYYLELRQGLPFYNHYFFVLTDDAERPTAMARAASLISALAAMAQDIAAGTFAADTQRGAPLEMEQYGRTLFSTFRLPAERRDRQVSAASTHIAVAVGGGFWTLEVVSAGRPATEEAIARALSEIVHQARGTPTLPQERVGLGTAWPRPTWARGRALLAAEPVTRAALACVDEALFVVALDLGSTPADSGAVADLVRQGNLDNRWFDKSLQLVVFANGKAALSFEHSAVDGHNGIRVAAEAQQRAAMPRCGRAESRLSPRRLVFRVPPEFCTMIESQRRDLAAQQAGRATRTLDAQGFGTTLWRALGVSADAAIQLALQLAAVRTWGELPAINEAVQLRHFRHGRYDTIYTVTPESRDFVQAVLRGEGGAAVVRAAAAAHRRLIAVCQRGDSPVLHYSAVLAAQRDHACLRADGEGLHVFGHRVARDPGYHALMHCRITTSNAGARPGVEVFGFADAEPGVLGAAYLVKADRVTLHLKADGELRSSLARFAHALAEALASVAAAAGSAVSPVVHHG